MNDRALSGTDRRAFRWPLSGLERARSFALDVAQLTAAARGRSAEDVRYELRAAQGRQSDELAAASAAHRWTLDLAVQSCSLLYLAQLGASVTDLAGRVEVADDEVDAARRACGSLHVELALLRKLRGRAEAAHRLTEARRHQREADFAWLARQAVRPANRNGGLL
jgi:hypothetical protein